MNLKKIIQGTALSLLAAMITTLPTVGATAEHKVVGRCDDMEDLRTGMTYMTNTTPVSPYCAFGTQMLGRATVSDKVAASGEKSICLSGRYGTGSTLKVNTLFTEKPEKVDSGSVYRISFKIYPDKEAGVYKNSADSIGTAIPFTAEELAESVGTEFSVIMAGPDGQEYKYRSGSSEILGGVETFFAAWNQWTEVNFYYTVSSDYLDNGSKDGRKNTYVDAFRLGQTNIDFSVDSGLANTFYIDDLVVERAEVRLDYSYDGSMLSLRNTNLTRDVSGKLQAYLLEYDSEGRLISSEIQDMPKTGTDIIYTAQNEGNPVTVLLLDRDKDGNAVKRTQITASPTPAGYGYLSAEALNTYAQKMLAQSKATYKDATTYAERLNQENLYLFATDDTFVFKSGSSASTTNGSDARLTVTNSTSACLRFDLTPMTEKSVSYAYVRLYTIDVMGRGDVSVSALNSSDWVEATLSGKSLPASGAVLDTVRVESDRVVYYFDVTEAVNAALAAGDKAISFIASASGNTSAKFISMETAENSFLPCLMLEGVGMKAGEKKLSSFDTENFIDVMKRKKTPSDMMMKTPTRVLESLTDFTPSEEKTELSPYGGWIDGGKYDATGFFYMKQIDGRWWIIDPLGYKTIHMAVSELGPLQYTSIQASAFLKEYGNVQNWANRIGDELREYGFNAAGPWSDYATMLDKATGDTVPLVQAGFNNINFSAAFWAKENYMFHVFDPAFEKRADRYAKEQIMSYADNPYILGWITDNEPPSNNDKMLEASLKADPLNSSERYTYYTAWAWLRDRYGENAKIEQITDKDRVDWVEFVYDRYMQICSAAIRKYDKNHMILGPKLDQINEGAMRGVAKYCDVILYDYYGNAFDADIAQIDQWYRWTGKPMINAEWYAKGMDACTAESGMTNEAGVGFSVETQEERGAYFQSFCLSMLESKVFVGWQWFRYMDNDPTDIARIGPTSSNLNANKGIITRDYKKWDVLLEAMKDIQCNVYDLIEYFDN